jgi:hypothetical protein
LECDPPADAVNIEKNRIRLNVVESSKGGYDVIPELERMVQDAKENAARRRTPVLFVQSFSISMIVEDASETGKKRYRVEVYRFVSDSDR